MKTTRIEQLGDGEELIYTVPSKPDTAANPRDEILDRRRLAGEPDLALTQGESSPTRARKTRG